MNHPPHLDRLLGNTRGQIFLYLRRESHTVSDISEKFGLTDNAVRQHLATLERDGLVRQAGERAGTRKPHILYQATEEAESLFPKVYDLVLNCLLDAITEHVDSETFDLILRDAGQRLTRDAAIPDDAEGFEDRAKRAVDAIRKLGGSASVETEEGHSFLCGVGRCPLGAVTGEHPELCSLVASALGRVTGLPVTPACRDGEGDLRCRFEIRRS